MAEVDDLVQGRPEQVLLTLVARSAHRDSPQPIAAVSESRSAQKRNPKSQENDAQTRLSCESRYFNRLAAPIKSGVGEFFTGDNLAAAEARSSAVHAALLLTKKRRVARGIATRPEGPLTVPRLPGGDRLGGRLRPEVSEAASVTDMGARAAPSNMCGVTPL
jgi:hypothetical protein